MANTTTNTSELLAEQVSQLLVQPLEAESVVLASGVRIFDTAGQLRIPKLVGETPAVTLVGESEEIPDTHTTDFDDITLMPSTRKSIKVIERFSREVVRQSVIGLDATLKARLLQVVSTAVDNHLLKGTGASDGIRGIVNQPGTQRTALVPTEPDDLLDAIGLAAAAEVTPNRWFLSGDDFIALRKLKEAVGSKKYLLESDITAGPEYRLFGIPVTVTNKLDTGVAVLADTSQIAVARDLAPSITVLNERYAEFDEIGLRVVTRYDLGLLHPEAVILLDSVSS